jgi:putative protease
VLSKQQAKAEAQTQLQKDLGRMAVAYSRGFSDGFFAGSDHQNLVEGRFPKHRGALLGVVAEVKAGAVRIERAERRPSGGVGLGAPSAPSGATKVALPVIGGASPDDARGVPLEVPEPVPGCGVGFDTGRPQEDEPGGPLFGVEPAPKGWWLRFGRPGPDLSRVRPGHQVFLSSDPRLTADAKGAPLRATFTASGPVGRGVSVSGETAEVLSAATGAGLGIEVLSDKLGGLGGTPFRLAAVDLEAFAPGLHVPVSALKALRRTLVAELEAQVLARARHGVAQAPVAALVKADASRRQPTLRWTPPSSPTVIPLVRRPEQWLSRGRARLDGARRSRAGRAPRASGRPLRHHRHHARAEARRRGHRFTAGAAEARRDAGAALGGPRAFLRPRRAPRRARRLLAQRHQLGDGARAARAGL